MSHRAAYLLLPVVWLSWGFAYPITDVAFREFDVWTSRVLIIVLGAVIMLAVAMLRGASIAVPRGQRFNLAIAALFNISIFHIGMSYGIYLSSPGRTSVIVYTMPLWATLFARLLLGERLTRNRLVALACGLAGLALLVGQDLSHLRNAPLGAALTLLGAMSFGFGTVWMKRCRWDMNMTAVGAGNC